MVNSINNNVLSFKNTNNAGAVSYNTRKTTPMPAEPTIEDMFIMQQLAEKQRAKEQSKKEKWQKAGTIAQIALSAAFVVIAGTSLYGILKGAGKAGTSKLTFEDIAKKVDFPNIGDDCVNPKVRDFITTMKKSSGLSEEVKKVSGAKNPEQFLLMYGPPGTGKTFSAKMMAKELGAEYAEVQFADVSSPYIGQTSVEIKSIFAALAKKAEKEPNKKFLVAFNEIDALLVPREKCGSNNLHLAENRTAFLNGLDLIEKFKNVKIVGTTNVHPDSGSLDKASLSRFGNMLEIELPTQKEVIAALKFHLKKGASAIENHKFFENNKNAVEKFAKELVDNKYSQRDIEKLASDAHNRFGNAIADSKKLSEEKFDIKYLKEAFTAKGKTTGTIDLGVEGCTPKWTGIEPPTQSLSYSKKFKNFLKEIFWPSELNKKRVD